MADFDGLMRMREHPGRRPSMFQSWRDLTFMHMACDPAFIRPLLPPGIELETFPDDSGVEKAWVGFVPFRMEGIHLRGLPAVPGTSAFPETNVRTYVSFHGKDPGVWFFSLDAHNQLACRVARTFFGLNYQFALMSVEREGDRFHYQSERQPKGSASHDVLVRPHGALRTAAPETFEFWLAERYLLYAQKGGKLWSGRVWHEPYRIQECEVISCEQTYTTANGIPSVPFVSVLHSPGVDVEIFSVEPVG